MDARQDKTTQAWTLALGAAASLMVALDALIVATALDTIGRDLGASIEVLEWTVNGYTLSFAVLMMTAAVAGDRFGRRRVFAAGATLFALASGACALAPDAAWLIGARVVQGVGAAIIMPLALAQVSAAFPPERRGWALGIYSSVTALSSIIGPAVGGAITQGWAWQWIFWINVPAGLALAGLALLRLKETFGPKQPPDFAGLVLVSLAAFGLVWGIVRANEAGWTSGEVIGALAGGVVAAIVFILWEARRDHPMIPMRLFRNRVFAAGNVAMFLLNGTLMASIFFLAQFQQVTLGQGPLMAGVRLLPWGLALVVAAPRAGALAERYGEASVVMVGLVLQAIGLVWLALVARPGLGYPELVAPMLAAGFGFALAVPIVQKAVVSAVAPSEIGKASGTLGIDSPAWRRVRSRGRRGGVRPCWRSVGPAGFQHRFRRRDGSRGVSFSRRRMCRILAAASARDDTCAGGRRLRRRETSMAEEPGNEAAESATPAVDFERLAAACRPQLHRYCSRMVGSVVDGEDVVQETLLKALGALRAGDPPANPAGWLFRIAHNAALDHLRRRAKDRARFTDEDVDMVATPTEPPVDAAGLSMRTFMRLPSSQRSAVILRDVLGHTVLEISQIVGGSVPAAKAALQRGRERLQDIAREPDDGPRPELSEADRRRLQVYVDRFNARDFDGLREMLAADVQLDLVDRLAAKGKDRVGEYFHRYSEAQPWRCVPGLVDGRPAVLMFDPNDAAGNPANFVLLQWAGERVAFIRDFHFARYAIECAEIVPSQWPFPAKPAWRPIAARQ